QLQRGEVVGALEEAGVVALQHLLLAVQRPSAGLKPRLHILAGLVVLARGLLGRVAASLLRGAGRLVRGVGAHDGAAHADGYCNHAHGWSSIKGVSGIVNCVSMAST